MRLTQWTDYTIRVLMYCAACRDRPQPVTIGEIAQSHRISRSHLTKVVQDLSTKGWLDTTRGRGGGLRLARAADEINLGDVVRSTETDFNLVECFDAEHNECGLTPHCQLYGVIDRAMQSFFAELDRVTLADLVPKGAACGMRASRTYPLVPGLPVRVGGKPGR